MKQLPEDIIATNDKIADAKELLRENGYYIYSIYHVDDVKTYFDCTDAEAMDVLDSALDNDATAETIWMAIRDIGDMMGLKEKKD